MRSHEQLPVSRFGRAVDTLEETIIAILLGLMTLVTFANVVARYVFNSNILCTRAHRFPVCLAGVVGRLVWRQENPAHRC